MQRQLLLILAGLLSIGAGTFIASPLAAQRMDATLDGKVSDEAGIFSETFEAEMQERLSSLEEQSGVSVILASAPGLHGAGSDRYARSLGQRLEDLGIVRKEWVVFVLVPADREFSASLSVSLGSPAQADKMLSDENKRALGQKLAELFSSAVVPDFSEDRWEDGMRAGVEALETLYPQNADEQPVSKQGDLPA